MDKIGLIVTSVFSLIIISIVFIINGYANYYEKRIFGKIDVTTNVITWLITGLFIFVAFWSIR